MTARRAAAWLRRCWERPKPPEPPRPWQLPDLVIVVGPDGSRWQAEPDWRRIPDPSVPGDLS